MPNVDFLPEPTSDQILSMGVLTSFDGAVPSEEGESAAETSDPTGDTGGGSGVPY